MDVAEGISWEQAIQTHVPTRKGYWKQTDDGDEDDVLDVVKEAESEKTGSNPLGSLSSSAASTSGTTTENKTN